MSSQCKNHFLTLQYRKIDGAVLQSQNERNLDCVITFQTHSILQRFMLRFDLLQLDCNDHLFIYDGAHAVGSYKVKQLDPCFFLVYVTLRGSGYLNPYSNLLRAARSGDRFTVGTGFSAPVQTDPGAHPASYT